MTERAPDPAFLLTATIPGHPYAQGSKRPLKHKHTGKIIMVESAGDELRAYRVAIARAMRNAVTEHGWPDGSEDGCFPVWVQHVPVSVEIFFYFRRPRFHYRTGANARLLRGNAPLCPTGPPDYEKLERAVSDAGQGIWWWKDSQICDGHGRKRYAELGEDERTMIIAWEFTG
jgi:hypothetical protein